MTPAFCQAKCAAAGYSFAGVEYSKECYCGNTLTNGGKSSTGCTYACAGDSSLVCGGNYAMNVFKLAGGSTSSSSSSSSSTTSSSSTSSIATTSTTSTSPTSSAVYGWSSVGCIVDQSARTLNAQSYSDTSMTPALCQSKCYAAGYTFAGTEYSSQCYCGNTLTNGGTSSSGCTSTCAGNSSLICGGSWALSVYKYTPSPASSSIASTISSTSSTISTSSAVSSTISSTSSSSSTTSTTSTTSASPNPTYTSLGCYRDSYNRVLSQGQGADTSTRTIQSCFAQCASLGYCYAGLETGSECWCNDSLLTSSDSGSKLSMDQCQMTCTGNSSQYCGGSWSLEIYYDGTKSKCKGPPTTSVVSSSSTTSTTTSTTTTSTQSTSTNGLWYQTNGSNTGKVIIAHVIVGNTYSYTTQQWINEIKMASAQGIDAFALDFGYDSWQATQMDSAYDAASSSGTGFKMLLSLDFTVLSCSDNSIITTNINKYKNHAAQLKDSSGNMWVQTFDGGSCRSDSQWNSVLRNNGIGIKFVPAFFNDETNTKMKDMFPSINGDFLWGGAWPKGNNVLDWSEDDYRISRSGLSRPPDVYMTTVAPLFFVHYSGRNSIWRSDDHLYARRWEDLFSHRALVDAVQIVTWNDYGESTYIGPIGKDMPSGTNWVTGFDHTPFLQMTGYYAWAFKTGQYPTITSDKIFFWGRPHSMNAVASNDGLGKPTNWNWTSDSLWIVLFSTGSGSLSVTMGSSSSTFSVSAGVNKFTLGLAQASSVTAKLTRNGVQVFSVQGAVTYTGSPSQYNWNYAAAAGP